MSPIVGNLELCDWVVYDEVTFAPGGALTRQMFSIPVGQNELELAYPVQLKTLECPDPRGSKLWKSYVKQFLHTNSLLPGMLDTCSMKISRLNVLFLTNSRPLRIFETSAYRKTYVELSINRKTYWASPAWQCASPFALFDTPKEEIAALGEKYGVAWKQIGASFDNHPLEIREQEYFTVRVQMYEQPEEELSCHVYLDGVETRAVM